MYYTNYLVGSTVYFLDGTDTVHRAKVVSITISHDSDGKTKVTYELVAGEYNYFSRDEKDLFRSPDSAFWSLDKSIEAETLAEPPAAEIALDEIVV